ncbi:MAG: hypothetical protein RLZZ620_47, partial [Pseudomonadota bacterium]
MDQLINHPRLHAYLGQLGLDTRSIEIESLVGGQSNPTYKIRCGSDYVVLRKKPSGKLLPSAHAIEREYRVMSALASTAVPVPKMLALCEDESLIGTPFYLMSYLAGQVFHDQSLPQMSSIERGAIYDEMNRVLAAIHQLDYRQIGLESFGKPGNYFARQISRWSKQYLISETEPIEAMHRLIEWLPAHIPDSEQSCIVHGDYRLDNMIFANDKPQVLAVLDWELSTLGHPLADFSYHCMSWHIPPGTFRGISGLDHVALGIPLESEYIKLYCD